MAYKYDKNPSGAYMLNRLDGKVNEAKNAVEKVETDGRKTMKLLKHNKKDGRWIHLLISFPFLLLVAFSLFFIVTRVFFSGFYAGDKHDLAMVSLIVSGGILLLLAVCFFIVLRSFRRTGIHWIRWLLVLLAMTVSVLSFQLLDASSFIVIAISLGVISLFSDILHTLRLRNGMDFSLAYGISQVFVLPALTLLTVVYCVLSSFGIMAFDGKEAYVNTQSFTRTVRYSKDGEDVKLEKIMLTARDVFEWEEAEAFTVLSEVKLDKTNEIVTVVGKDAFKCVRSFAEVVLPESIVRIEAGAFENSKIKVLTVHSANLLIEDGLAGSSIEQIRILNGEAKTLTFGEGVTLLEGISVLVPRESIDEYRKANPVIADRFTPEIGENEVFANFHITAPAESGLGGYIPTQIAEKFVGNARIALPYEDKVSNTDLHGWHWVHTVGNDVYRLFYLTANGEKMKPSQFGCVALTDKSLNIYGEWERVYTVRADYTAIGGGVTNLGELYEEIPSYELPTGVKHGMKVGYECNEWYLDEGLTERAEEITDWTRDWTVYPKWDLEKPVLDEKITILNYSYSTLERIENYDTKVSSLEGVPFVYDGMDYEIKVEASHVLDGVQLSYTWINPYGEIVSDTEILSFRTCDQSGTYTLEVRAEDGEGNFATASKTVEITVAPATLHVNAEAKTSVYGEEDVPLTYTYEGLLTGDNITGELARESGNDAGVYAITQGTLSAGVNYKIVYTGAEYTITKASYTMAGVSYADGSLPYNGTRQTVKITGELPTGLDGIQVTVRYEGGAKDVAEGAKLTTAIFETASGNYEIPEAMTAYTTITPKDITVTADDKTATYGVSVPLTYTVNGLEDGDGFTGELSREAGDDVGEYDILKNTLSAGGNYVIAYTGGTYTVVKAHYDMSGVSYADGSLTYNGARQTVKITGELPTGLDGVQVTVRYEGGAKDVAEGKQLTTAIFETASGNYETPAPMTAYTTITQKSVAVTAENASQVYGESEALLNFDVDGIVGEEFSSVKEGFLTREVGNDVGEYDILLGTLSFGGNYEISFKGATYTITKAHYNMSGVSYTDGSLTYNGARQTVKITGELPTGLDGLQVTVRYEGGAKDVAEGAQLTTAIFETASGNYEIPASMTAYTTITPKSVTVTAEDKTSIYGEEILPLTYKTEGILPADSGRANVTATLAKEEGNDVGMYAITFLSCSIDNGNYSVETVEGSYEIAKATVELPRQNAKFEHTGESIVGVAETEFYTVTNGTGTEVGTYTATVALRDSKNYRWADEDFDGKVTWSIEDTDGLS